jgi:hypothetical protein
LGKSTYNTAHENRRKNEAESALKRLIDALEETSSEELELSGSNPCDKATNTDQQ